MVFYTALTRINVKWISNKEEGLLALGSIERFSLAGVLLVIMVPRFLRNIQLFVFGPLSSNMSRWRLYCTSSFHIFVDLYLTEFLPYIFTVQMLETKTVSKTISKTNL